MEALKNPATMADAAKTLSSAVEVGRNAASSAASAVRGALAPAPAAPDVNQPNIDRVTAELGRHAGDVGEKKRLKALMQKRRAGNRCRG